MRISFTVFALLMIVSCPSAGAKDFVISINGVQKELALDQEDTLLMADGTSLTLLLHRKEYASFTSDLFSFGHKSMYQPNRINLGDGVFQTMVGTPHGTTVLVQEYLHMDPTNLVDIMLHEITKEEVDYGYEYTDKTIEKTVGDATFVGKLAITSYPGDEWTRCVLALGRKDRGLLVVTFIEKDNLETDQDLIDHFWMSMILSEEMR